MQQRVSAARYASDTSSRIDTESAEREAIDYTIALSRRDLSWVEADLESSLALSLEEEVCKVGLDKSILEASGSTGAVQDIVATQKEILTQVAQNSENEYIEKAIISSLCNDASITEDQIIQQIQIETRDKDIIGSSVAADADPELATVLELSKLSEDEALALALKESMSQALPIVSEPFFDQSYQSLSNNHDMDEDAMLQAALAASMDPSFQLGHFDPYMINDDDEDISRAIAESLKR